MCFERARVLEAVRVAARMLQLALCAAALVAMAIKFFVVVFVVVAAALGMLVAAIDGFPHWFSGRRHHDQDAGDEAPSRLSRLLTKHCPYSKRQTVDMLLALLLLAAGVAFLASDTMDSVCDAGSSTSTVEKAADAAESAIDSLGFGDGSSSSGSASSGSSDSNDASSSIGCVAVKTSVGCVLVGALLFLVTIALTCPPFSRHHATMEDGGRATEEESNKPSTEDQDQHDIERGSDYHSLHGGSPRAQPTPTHAD